MEPLGIGQPRVNDILRFQAPREVLADFSFLDVKGSQLTMLRLWAPEGITGWAVVPANALDEEKETNDVV